MGEFSTGAIMSAPLSLDVTLTISPEQLAAIQSEQQLSRLRSPGVTTMPQLPFSDQGGPALKIWTPDSDDSRTESPPEECAQDSAGAHRIVNPVRTPEEAFEQIACDSQSGPQPVPQHLVAKIRSTLTLQEFHERWMQPWREEQIAQGAVKRGTTSKDRQALNRFQRWELANKPDDWPAGEVWKGVAIKYINGGYLDKFFRAMMQSYAKDTIISTRNHLRTVFNHAVEIGVLESAPKPSPLDLEDLDDVEEDLATIWFEDEINELYREISRFDLRVAFVLGCNCGPRTVDLFGLRWEKNIRLNEEPAMIRFRARKTKKKHGIPLHPVCVAHLKRLQREYLYDPQGLVFPELTSGNSKDPEKSRAARRRNKMIKTTMREHSLPDHFKPWQVCRATCCTRLNNVNSSAIGSWVIGQASQRAGTQLAADFYYNPSEIAVATIMQAPQPKAFMEVV